MQSGCVTVESSPLVSSGLTTTLHGNTVSRTYDAMLDKYIELRFRETEAVKQLHKLAFIHPQAERMTLNIIKILEGKK